MKMNTALLYAVAIVLSSSANAQNIPNLKVVAAEAMPVPPPPSEAEKFLAGNAVVGPQGEIQYKDAKKFTDFHRSMNIALEEAKHAPDAGQPDQRAKPAVKDLSKIKMAFKPKKQPYGHRLLVASPAGMSSGKGWTGLERYFSIPNVGTYKLMELDLAKTGGKFFLAADAINTNIENSPAGTKTIIDGSGNTIEEAVWVANGKFHMLTFAPETFPAPSTAGKTKRNTAITAVSLAQSLSD